MAGRRLLLMHVTTSSGHHHASRAIAQALQRLDPACQIINVDAFDYTSRFVRWAIQRSYHSLIRHYPNVWEYLYDNPEIHRHTQRIRNLLHRYHTRKLRRLLETVQPHAIACTQAFPCGMVADFKLHRGLHIPLVGILTDYAPHLYWLHDTIDAYVVPAHELKERFLSYGVPEDRLRVYGIPVEPRFLDPVDRRAVYAEFGLEPDQPVVLIMGGGSGFGPMRETMQHLDALEAPCQLVVLAGTNRALLDWFSRQRFRHPVHAFGYVEAVPQLMEIASLIITKPGGLTTAEALAKHLPMVILSPIPGQEMCNARYLLDQGAAIQLDGPQSVGRHVGRLLRDPQALQAVRERAAAIAHPDSAAQTAQLLLELAARHRNGP
ncbi:MAG: hypothetical protein HYY91_01685 [Candidatus Omnitrophica bacterium]|nr:hypothetical protein [Candidatus Omnitrophota bacterium]